MPVNAVERRPGLFRDAARLLFAALLRGGHQAGRHRRRHQRENPRILYFVIIMLQITRFTSVAMPAETTSAVA